MKISAAILQYFDQQGGTLDYNAFTDWRNELLRAGYLTLEVERTKDGVQHRLTLTEKARAVLTKGE